MNQFLALQPVPPGRDAPADFALIAPLSNRHRRAGSYRPAPGLAEAMDVAMMLGVPLLLTGRPGTGKTQAAYWLAAQLGRPVLKYDVKSVTSGSDLLYTFDEVARFRDASARETRPLIDYVRFNPLGLAILKGGGGAGVLTDPVDRPLSTETATRAFGEAALAGGAPTAARLLPDDDAFAAATPEHCVVLIDEFDKAPRDTANDLLAEIETMRFVIPELGVKIPAGVRRPIVILTSNSERALPEPFLRRCAFFDIPPPSDAELALIVSATLGTGGDAATSATLNPDSPLLKSAVGMYRAVCDDRDISRTPGTAELLAWFDVLLTRLKLPFDATIGALMRDDASTEAVARTLSALVKSPEDLRIARRVLRETARG